MYLALPFLLVIVFSIFHLFLSNKKATFVRVLELLLLYLLFINGISAFLTAFSYLFLTEGISMYYGWPIHPLHVDVAFSYLAVGILGVLTPFFRKGGFWFANILLCTAIFWGAAYSHFCQKERFHHYVSRVSEGKLWVEILVPVIMIVFFLVVMTHKKKKQNK